MIRPPTLRQLLAAAALLAVGWIGAKAQTPSADFELIVNAPAGETSIECSRGCKLKWIERGNTAAIPQSSFTFACSGAATRCSSARIGGWVDPQK